MKGFRTLSNITELDVDGYEHIVKRADGYYFYDPAYFEDGPYPTPKIADAALTYYMDYIF